MNTPKFYSNDRTGPNAPAASTSMFSASGRAAPAEPQGLSVPKVAMPGIGGLGLLGRLKVSGVARDATVQALGEMIVNEVRLVRDAALHGGQLKLAQHKSLALRDYLEANTVISQQLSRISRAAEKEMVGTFHDEMAAIVSEHTERLRSIADRENETDPSLVRLQRDAVERWTGIQLGNIEARMTLILQRYAQQFEATLAQFSGTQLGGQPS